MVGGGGDPQHILPEILGQRTPPPLERNRRLEPMFPRVGSRSALAVTSIEKKFN